MSEPKRIALTTLVAAEASTPAATLPSTKKDKKSAGQEAAKTHRFSLTLPDSTEKSCPEFNYADLITSLPQKKKENHVTNGSSATTNPANPAPLDPFAEDDEDQLRNIAKKFEEKYGAPVAKKKKSRKYDDYVDLGAGYDETDPFIDNTDAYDEIVPAEVTTAHGGFYINSGALEFKPVEKRSESESESESSSSESESDDSLSESSTTPVATSKKRRIIDSDSDDSKDEIQLNGSELDESKKKKLKLDDSIQLQVKRKKVSPTVVSGNESVPPKKNRPSVKELLQFKREKEGANAEGAEGKSNKTNLVSVPTTSPAIAVKESLQPKKDRDVAEVTIAKSNATAATTDDTSSDSSGSSSDSSDSESGEEEEEDGKDTAGDAEAKLPNNLTSATLAIIEDIKKAATSSDQQGKCRFFSPEVNRLLLAIELQARQYSCSKRQAIYTYLASFLPCTKHTLLKRAKNLVLEDVDAKLKPAIRKLQQAVEKVIGEQIERHATQCQRLAEAKDPELEPAGGTDEDEKKPTNKQPQPRRRFQWSKETRSILNQVVYLKAECFHWSKLRKESASEFLMRFLDSEIKQLWPKGWMTAKILFKESHEGHSFVTAKSKQSPGTKKPPVTPRVGLVDTLAPQAPSVPSTAGLSASSTSSTTPSVVKEVKKSQLKDRMSSVSATTPAQSLNLQPTPPPNRGEPNSVRNDHSSHPSSVQGGKARTEGNGTVKVDSQGISSKQRPRPDPTCSAARTEIHHITKTDGSKANHRLENHSFPESNSGRNDHATDPSKVRSETPKTSSNQVRSDLVGSTRDSLPVIKVNKVDSMKLQVGSRMTEASRPQRDEDGAKNRMDSKVPKEDPINLVKTDGAPSEASHSANVNTKPGASESKPAKSSPSVPPSRTTSLASFVDSGFPWKEDPTSVPVLDLSDDEDIPHQTSRTSEPSTALKHGGPPPRAEDVEDQESLLQRDLAMVLEEISQMNQLGEKLQQVQQQQPQIPTKVAESRTKSVIKATGRASPGVSAPPLTVPNVAPKPVASSVPAVPPRLTAATRTSPPVISPSSNRISPSGNAAPVKSISSNQPHASSSPPTSSSGSLHAQHLVGKMMGSDFPTPPTAHSSSRHLPAYSEHHISPEKIPRNPDSLAHQQLPLQHQPPPLPAHQQLSTAGSIARSSPNTVFRNYPSSSAHIVTSPTSNPSAKGISSHSIESLMQLKKSPVDPLPAHRPVISSAHLPQPAILHQPQLQQQQHTSIPKHDPLSYFMTQKNSQTNPHGADYYYSQAGAGHHQHSS